MEFNDINESDFACVSREYIVNVPEWKENAAFSAPHHVEEIEAYDIEPSQWRVKDKLKTVSVALVICLNVDVDPPDVVKPSPCARMHCWLNPTGKNPTKAIDEIGNLLHAQYARWQTKARYKPSLDPTIDDIKKLTTGLRKVSKDDRVLFHYNGHGVPKPTKNGELWVFNKNYTQYIPVSILDLQMWVGAPSVYVYDCHNAGIIVEKFEEFCNKRSSEAETGSSGILSNSGTSEQQAFGSPEMTDASALNSRNLAVSPSLLAAAGPPHTQMRIENCIQLAACSADELLPLNPELPADLFTACLTTPVKAAMRFHLINHRDTLPSQLDFEMLDKMPGTFAQRISMVGELNWIFTAITDSIAWNLLPRDLFTRLFRQDLLVASLFRNFLLANRLLRVYGCQPVSLPRLPDTNYHHLWDAWDYVCDLFLRQIPDVVAQQDIQRQQPGYKESTAVQQNFCHSDFFADQLQAFDVWLSGARSGHERCAEQLPIVLQVLLSQQLRLRALELLSRFLDLGSWAITQALQVGIFPYVLRLLQSTTRELRPMLVFVWCKILAWENSESVVGDLLKEGSFKYFITVLADPDSLVAYKTMSAFVLARLLDASRKTQEAAVTENLIPVLLEVLEDPQLKPSAVEKGEECFFGLTAADRRQYRASMSENENDNGSAPVSSFHCRIISGVLDARRCRQFVIFCLGKLWCKYDSARWFAVRNTAHERIYPFLEDSSPEVRAATVYALGTFVNNNEEGGAERSDHANAVDHSVGLRLIHCAQDACPLVRRELVTSLSGLVDQFEDKFVTVAFQQMEEQRFRKQMTTNCTSNAAPPLSPSRPLRNASLDLGASNYNLGGVPRTASPFLHANSTLHKVNTSPNFPSLLRNVCQLQMNNHSSGPDVHDLKPTFANSPRRGFLNSPKSAVNGGVGVSLAPASSTLHRVNSLTSLNRSVGGATGNGNFYTRLWNLIALLSQDTHPNVAKSAKVILSRIRHKILKKVCVYSRDDGYNSNQTISSYPPCRPAAESSTTASNVGSSISRNCRAMGLADPTIARSAPGSPTNSRRLPGSSPNISNTRLLDGYPHSVQYPNVTRKLFGAEVPHTQSHAASSTNPVIDDNQDRSSMTSRSPSPAPSTSSTIQDDAPLPELATQFFQWSCRRFAEPLTRLPAERDVNSTLTLQREYRSIRCHAIRCDALNHLVSPRVAFDYQQISAPSTDTRQEDWTMRESINAAAAPIPSISVLSFCVQTQHQPYLLRLHSFEPHLCVADRQGVSVYDTLSGRLLRYLAPLRPWQENSRLTCMQFVNEIQEPSLLLTGASDGSVRVWRNYYPYLGGAQELATAFVGLDDLRHIGGGQGFGMVCDWDATWQRLVLGGDSNVVRVWDMSSELPLLDVNTASDYCTTAVSLCGSMLAMGSADGWLRLVDIRESVSERKIMKHRADDKFLLEVALQPFYLSGPRIVTVGRRGRVSIFDLRWSKQQLINNFETLRAPTGTQDSGVESSGQLAVAAVHALSPLVVTGQARNGLHFYQLASGQSCGQIQYVNNFDGTRMGCPNAVHFHPLRPQLAVAYADNYSKNNVSIFSTAHLATETNAAANAMDAATKM